jgi:hypothetical protein
MLKKFSTTVILILIISIFVSCSGMISKTPATLTIKVDGPGGDGKIYGYYTEDKTEDKIFLEEEYYSGEDFEKSGEIEPGAFYIKFIDESGYDVKTCNISPVAYNFEPGENYLYHMNSSGEIVTDDLGFHFIYHWDLCDDD